MIGWRTYARLTPKVGFTQSLLSQMEQCSYTIRLNSLPYGEKFLTLRIKDLPNHPLIQDRHLHRNRLLRKRNLASL